MLIPPPFPPNSPSESPSARCFRSNGAFSNSCRFHLTIHGLWPNYKDGTWPQFCDSDRKFDVDKVSDLRHELQEQWPSVTDDDEWDSDETFWEHEWSKHGTCSRDVLPTEHSYFKHVLDLHSRYDLAVSGGRGERPTGHCGTDQYVKCAWTAVMGILAVLSGWVCNEVGSLGRPRHGWVHRGRVVLPVLPHWRREGRGVRGSTVTAPPRPAVSIVPSPFTLAVHKPKLYRPRCARPTSCLTRAPRTVPRTWSTP
jgi:hypothetical protein